jgi:hypothetical protein
VVELSAGVENGHHDLGRADPLGVHPDRDAAAVVFDRDRTVEMHDHADVAAMAGQMFVDAVVDRLPDQVMQTRSIVDVADVHPRPFADRLEAFENGDVLGTVGRLRSLGDGRGACGFGHSDVSVQPSLDLRSPPPGLPVCHT